MSLNRFLSVEEIEDLGEELPAGQDGEAVQVLVEPEVAEEVNQDAATLESVSDAIGQAMNDEAVMASTIANVEGDMPEVSSSEEDEVEVEGNGEEVDVTVQPEFTADDVENDPMTVGAAANDAVASVESFYNRIAGALYTKGMGVKNITKFTGVNVSFEDLVNNPYQTYKAAHEGIIESIKVFFVKMKQFFRGLIDKIFELIRRARKWWADSYSKDGEKFDKIAKIKSGTKFDIETKELKKMELFSINNQYLEKNRELISSICKVSDFSKKDLNVKIKPISTFYIKEAIAGYVTSGFVAVGLIYGSFQEGFTKKDKKIEDDIKPKGTLDEFKTNAKEFRKLAKDFAKKVDDSEKDIKSLSEHLNKIEVEGTRLASKEETRTSGLNTVGHGRHLAKIGSFMGSAISAYISTYSTSRNAFLSASKRVTKAQEDAEKEAKDKKNKK